MLMKIANKSNIPIESLMHESRDVAWRGISRIMLRAENDNADIQHTVATDDKGGKILWQTMPQR